MDKVSLSRMSAEDKVFFRRLLEILNLFHRQREALFQILRKLNAENWEPIYRIIQNEPDIVQSTDELFAAAYASIGDGKRDSETLEQFSKDPLAKWKPN
jgi:hypothetical protein